MRGPTARRWVLAALGGLVAAPLLLVAGPAQADDDQSTVAVTVEIPGSRTFEVRDAELRWGLNREAGGGAFFGGCNFLSAGPAGPTGNAGSSHVWREDEGLYAARSGRVAIEKPDATGAYVPATWATKCQNPFGRTVSAASVAEDNFTGNQVVVDGGVGTVDQADGTARIEWTGSFTVVFYGGLTYWTASDPVLTVANGTGTLTATVSGYGADMDDPTRWVPLEPRTVTLANLRGVAFGAKGFEVVPDYLGVAVRTGTGTPQAARRAGDEGYWGSFPQSFVDFQVLTGQSSYWYTSGLSRDRAKPATALTVSYDAADPVDNPLQPPVPGAGAAAPSNRAVFRPAASGGLALTGAPAEAAARVVPAVAADTVLAAAPLIPPAAAGPGGPTAQQVAALGGLVSLVLAAGAALGLVKGWLVLPWRP